MQNQATIAHCITCPKCEVLGEDENAYWLRVQSEHLSKDLAIVDFGIFTFDPEIARQLNVCVCKCKMQISN